MILEKRLPWQGLISYVVWIKGGVYFSMKDTHFLHFQIQFHFKIKLDKVRGHSEESWLIENNNRCFILKRLFCLCQLSSTPHRTETKTKSSRAKCLF